MSYILDALSKADARRQHAPPDLYARSGLDDAARSHRSTGWHPAWLWLLAALLVMGSVAALWLMLRKTSPPAAPLVQAAPPVAKAAPVAASTPAAPALVAQAPVAVTLPVPAVPKPASAAVPAIAKPVPPKAPAPAPPQPVPQPAKLPAPAPSKPPAAQVPLYAALSPAVKGQMPALSVGGSVYSPQPAARMVVLNGQVLREGDKVSDGLTLESIGPKASTLNWQGTRFQLPH